LHSDAVEDYIFALAAANSWGQLQKSWHCIIQHIYMSRGKQPFVAK